MKNVVLLIDLFGFIWVYIDAAAVGCSILTGKNRRCLHIILSSSRVTCCVSLIGDDFVGTGNGKGGGKGGTLVVSFGSSLSPTQQHPFDCTEQLL
jgi:hypothetical protein